MIYSNCLMLIVFLSLSLFLLQYAVASLGVASLGVEIFDNHLDFFFGGMDFFKKMFVQVCAIGMAIGMVNSSVCCDCV